MAFCLKNGTDGKRVQKDPVNKHSEREGPMQQMLLHSQTF